MAISPQTPKYNGRVSRRQKLGYDVLSDPGNRVAAGFGLRFELPEALKGVYTGAFKLSLEKYNGDDSWTLPVPARFVIASSGEIVSADADPDYTVRPEPSETIEILRSHVGASA